MQKNEVKKDKELPLTGLRVFISVHLGWLIVGTLIAVIGIAFYLLNNDTQLPEKVLEEPIEKQETIYGDEAHPQEINKTQTPN